MNSNADTTFSDPQLGDFILNEDLDWFQGSFVFQGRRIVLNLEERQGIEVLRKILSNPESFLESASRYAAGKLLSNSNSWGYDAWANEIIAANNLPQAMTQTELEGWLRKNRPGTRYVPLSADDFVRRISIKSILVWDDDSYLLSFDDGNLFWGHEIQVDGDLPRGFIAAKI